MNNSRLLKRFFKYVQIGSETLSERDFALVLMEELKDLGFEVIMDDAGKKTGSNSGNIIGKLKGNKKANTIMFSAHMDTVKPGQGIKPEIRDGYIYSDGTTILGGDDKAGVAAIMEACQKAIEENIEHGDIEVIFSIYEEGGLLGAKNIDMEQIQAKHGFVLDSSGDVGEIIVQAPSQYELEFLFKGRSAHAGLAPEEGLSAIEMAAEAITNMPLNRIDEETTANIGQIHGGLATNIIPNEVLVLGEARSLNHEKLEKQKNKMVNAVKEVFEKYEMEGEIKESLEYEAFNISEDDEIVQIAKEAIKSIDIEPKLLSTGGGSDANVYNKKGLKTLNFAVGMEEVHTVNERISIENLENAANLVLSLIKTVAQ